MICEECYFKEICYAANDDRKECDPCAEKLKDEYNYHKSEIARLEEKKKTVDLREAARIEIAIDQIQDYMEYCCVDMSRSAENQCVCSCAEEDLPF